MEHPIFSKIENAKKPDFGDILSKSFDLYKKVWEQAFYHVLVTIAITIPFIMVIYVPYFLFVLAITGHDRSGFGYDFGYYEHQDITPFIPFLVVYVIVVMVLALIIEALSLGIVAHFFKVLKKVDTGSSEDVGSFFDLIKGNFKKLFLLALSNFGIALLAVLACYFPIFYVLVPLQLMVVFYAFHPDLTISEIVKASFKLGNKFWLIIFGLIIIGSLLAQLGILLCFVGLLFTAFFTYVPIYYVYKDSIGFDDTSLEQEVDNSL